MFTLDPPQLLDVCIKEQGVDKPLIWPGDIILVHSPNSISGKIIRLGTQSYFNHATIYMGNGMTLEADHKGLHLQHLNFYIEKKPDHKFVIVRPDVVDTSNRESAKFTIADGENVVRHGLKYADIGHKYDFIALAGFFFRFLGMSIPSNPFNIKPMLFCSESVKSVYADAGYTIVPDFPPSLTSPGDIDRDDLIFDMTYSIAGSLWILE